MIYFTSDHHFYHNNVIRYCDRPYNNVEEMNEDLVNKWNSVVTNEDEVYYLGDFSMAFRPVELFTARLNGKKYLVPGNHDFVHSSHKKSRSNENKLRWVKMYEDNGWIVLPEQIMLEGYKLCHLPYKTTFEDIYGDNYNKHRPEDDGTILLCGHVHEKWKTAYSTNGTFMINVGVDVNKFMPISIDEINSIVKTYK